MFTKGDGVFHSKKGPGLVEIVEDDVVQVRLLDGSLERFSLADFTSQATKLDRAGFRFLDLTKQITAERVRDKPEDVLSALLKEAPLGELRKADAARLLKGRYVIARDWEGWWRRAVDRAKANGLLSPHQTRNVFIAGDQKSHEVDIVAMFSAARSALERRELLNRYVARERTEKDTDDDKWKFLLGEYVKGLEQANILEGLYGLAVLHSNASVGAKKGIEALIRERVVPWSDLRRDFRYGPTSPLPRGVERTDHSGAQLVHPFRQVEGSHAGDAWTVRGLSLVSLVNPTALFRDTSAASTPAPHRRRSRVGRSITSDATRVARCAGESDERGFPSSSSRRVAG
jgi:hypothetical protein